MADTLTNNLLLTKPEIGGSADTWGTKLNVNMDAIDAIFAANGGGTSVGLNVGEGKTLTVGGTMNVDGTANFTGPINATGTSPWITSTQLMPAGLGGSANMIPRMDPRGNIGWESLVVGDYVSGGGVSAIQANVGTAGADYKVLRGHEFGKGALVWGADFVGMAWNSEYSNGTWKKRGPGRSWMTTMSDKYFHIACTEYAGGVDNAGVAGDPSNFRWTWAVSELGQVYTYMNYAISDRRIKDNLEVIPAALQKVQSISGYTYTMDRTGDMRHAGVIAQEVQDVLPEAVTQPEEGALLGVNYAALTALLIEAVKDLAARVENLEGLL
jgi:hypothetical protein